MFPALLIRAGKFQEIFKRPGPYDKSAGFFIGNYAVMVFLGIEPQFRAACSYSSFRTAYAYRYNVH
jgi:hypothetical protein